MSNLTIRGLTKLFGNTRVLNDISLEVSKGEFCILLGPSGCGKTTILRLIAGLDQQESGDIFIGETNVRHLTPKDRDIAMVFQSYALYPHLTVLENLSFSLKIRKKPKHDIDLKVNATAKLLGISELLHRKPRELSGGQRQRVAIGRAIVRSPKLFLFDEPLSNLDAKLRSSMRVELAKLHQQLKATIIYVTHDQVEAMTLGQKIILLDKGIIQQVGTPDEIYHEPANLFAASFIGTPQLNLIEGEFSLSGNTIIFKSEHFSIATKETGMLRPFVKKKVILGVRPEALTPGEGPIHGTLELTEHLGPETLLYVDANGIRLTAKADSRFQGNPGDPISLGVSGTGIHFFYEGKRLKGV